MVPMTVQLCVVVSDVFFATNEDTNPAKPIGIPLNRSIIMASRKWVRTLYSKGALSRLGHWHTFVAQEACG